MHITCDVSNPEFPRWEAPIPERVPTSYFFPKTLLAWRIFYLSEWCVPCAPPWIRHWVLYFQSMNFCFCLFFPKDEVQIQTTQGEPFKNQNEPKCQKKTASIQRKRTTLRTSFFGEINRPKQRKTHSKFSIGNNGKTSWKQRLDNSNNELNDNKLSKLASIISATAMRTIALEYFDIDNVSIDDIETSRRENVKQFKLDLLISWRNKNRPSTQVKSYFYFKFMLMYLI